MGRVAIPGFDRSGNLPPGVHRATLEEVAARFGGIGSLRRIELTDRLRQFCGAIGSHAVGVYINGSYVTSELAPRDVDLIVVLPPDFDMRSPAAQVIREARRTRQSRLLHVFPCRKGKENAEIDLFLRVFTSDRRGRQKGIVYLEMNP